MVYNEKVGQIWPLVAPVDRVIKNISGWQMQLECPPLSSSRNTSQYYRYIVRIKWYEMIQCFRIAMTRKALQRCVRPSQPALLLDRWHIPPHSKSYLICLWCKEFPAFSQIICDKCARCQNLCLLCQPLSTRGSNANQGRWFTSLEGGLTVTWKEKIFRIWGRVCCSNLLPKGEFSPKIPPRGKSWCRYVVSSASSSLR